MKFSKLIFFSFVFFLVFQSCKKESTPPVDLSNTTWIDSAKINGIIYKPFTIKFNANGTAGVKIGSFSEFPGSWNKTPNSVTVYFFFDESATIKWKGEGNLSDNNTVISGTLTRTAPSVFNGTFNVKKQ